MNRPLVVILGAGKPFSGTKPSALVHPSGNKRALDWIMEAFSTVLDDPEFHFVGGYRMSKIIEEYPNIHFSLNEEWEVTGSVTSLFSAPIPEGRPVYITYSDTVFEETAVRSLEGDTSVAIDRKWRTRYSSRTNASLSRAEKVRIEGGFITDADTEIPVDEADGEFTGLARLSPEAVERARALWNSRTLSRKANLPELIRALSATGIEVRAVDIDGRWAELETAEDLSHFILDTKANALRRLRTMVKKSVILDQHTFTVAEWKEDAKRICKDVKNTFSGREVIIRSSALVEDGWTESNAGRFKSILDVPSNDEILLTRAVDTVIESYSQEDHGNQVLVQAMIRDVNVSGVVMTRTLETGSPYYVINYDDTSSTRSVTDGSGNIRSIIIRKDIVSDEQKYSYGSYPGMKEGALAALLDAVNELEYLIGHDGLDIEFALNEEKEVFILQARPIILDPSKNGVDDEIIYETIDQSQRVFSRAQPTPPFLQGERTIFGVMPDWNPAEIIGRKPRQLAASLYRYLIMNETWARQRAEYGYRDVRPHPLMKNFAGQPYVNVRADFNSFIPESVPDELAGKLVEYYIKRLESNPEYHDKVEFKIVLTCLTFDYEDLIKPLLEYGFSKEELEPLRKGLLGITKESFRRMREEIDVERIRHLEQRYQEIISSDMHPLKKAYYLLEDCRRFGTHPFAHIARTAFVATSLIRALTRIGVLTEDDSSAFLGSINTIAREFEKDVFRVHIGEMKMDELLEKYGHLRPGTYDITSPTYKTAPEMYLGPAVERGSKTEPQPDPNDIWDEDTKGAMEMELRRIGLPEDANDFANFLVRAIEWRERSKFIFSRNLSDALELIAGYGEKHGLSREDMSYISLENILELSLDHPPSDINSWLMDLVRRGREAYTITTAVELPPLLCDEMDFLVFQRMDSEPNYITNSTVTGQVIEIKGDGEDLSGKIVLTEQADPGYDWLFGHDIAGLITKYGGSNSHMAVRAAEFSLPAAIGVGDNLYEQLRRAEVIELNCAALNIRVIK